MGDYGIRISEEGKDVKTCTDLECVFTSKYSLAKGGIEGTATDSDTGYYDDGLSVQFTINHNYGFIPVVRIFMVDADGNFLEIPETEWQAGVYVFDIYYEHTNTNRIDVYASLWVDDHTLATFEVTIAYFISLEKVNI